jgi:hypothetical protein
MVASLRGEQEVEYIELVRGAFLLEKVGFIFRDMGF